MSTARPLAFPFDTETTGLVHNRSVKLDRQPEIIEFYGCMLDLKSGKVKSEYHTLIRPTVEFPMSAYTIKVTKTKLSNEMLADAPTFKEVADDIRKHLEKAPMIIAHNLSFDMEMVEIEFERLGQTINWPINRVCTVEQTVHMRGHRLNLTKLHQLLFKDEGFEDAHRAKADVGALSRISVELHKRGMI
jgi:DNA polymerase-3 subunit epsilon